MKYYVYVLFKIDTPTKLPIDDNISFIFKPYYIGKGTGNRIKTHKNIKNTKHKKDAVTKSLLDKNYNFTEFSQIIKYFEKEEDAYNYEKLLVDIIGLHNLCNYNGGGEGGYTTFRQGKTYENIYGEKAEEIRLKISQSNTGKIPSKETLQKKSDSAKDYWAKNKELHSIYLRGRKMPPYISALTSERMKKLKRIDEWKSNISKAMTGTTQSEEHKYNAAKSRAKYNCYLNINNKKYYNIIRSDFVKILDGYGIKKVMSMFYRLLNKKYMKIGNVRVVMRRMEELGSK